MASSGKNFKILDSKKLREHHEDTISRLPDLSDESDDPKNEENPFHALSKEGVDWAFSAVTGQTELALKVGEKAILISLQSMGSSL